MWSFLPSRSPSRMSRSAVGCWTVNTLFTFEGGVSVIVFMARSIFTWYVSRPNLQGASRSFRSEREDLIRIRIGRGPLHDVEAKVGGLMAAVARLGERVERRFEPPRVFLLYRCPQAFDRRPHHT